MNRHFPTIQKTEIASADLPMWKVLFFIFVPTLLLTLAYLGIGHFLPVQKAIPSLLLFFLLAVLILFPIEIMVDLFASKKEFGRYSLLYRAGSQLMRLQGFDLVLIFTILQSTQFSVSC